MNITRLVQEACGANLTADQLHMAFEQGSDDQGEIAYDHCHLTVGFKTPQKPPMRLVYKLKALCNIDDKGRQPNLGMNYVPKGDKQSAKIGAYAVLLNYITKPHKKKQVDGGVLEFTLPPAPTRPSTPPHGHSQRFVHKLTWEHLPNLRAKLDRLKTHERLRSKRTPTPRRA